MPPTTARRPFTFVVRTKDGSGILEEKSQVNAHIARVAHQKRRDREKERQALENQRVYHHFQQPYAVQPGSPSLCLSLWQGRSDPFNAYAITIDANISYLLAFNRECLMPRDVNSEVLRHRAMSWSAQFDQDTSTALQDDLLAYSYLSRFASVVATIILDPKIQLMALTYKDITTNKLRNQVRQHNGVFHPNIVEYICWPVYSLLASEVASHEFAASAVHAKFLRGLLQPENEPAPLITNQRLLRSIIWQDIQRAVLTLTPTTFDLYRWSADYLAHLPKTTVGWQDLLESNGSAPPKIVIDEVMECSGLKGVFRETKTYFSMIGVLITDSMPLSDFMSAVAARATIVQGHLINNYVMISAAAKKLNGSDPGHILHKQAYTCIATLYWLRVGAHLESESINRPPTYLVGTCSSSSNSTSNNFDTSSAMPSTPSNPSRASVYSTGPGIIKALRQALADSKEDALANIDDPVNRARLWALYVGSIAEQAQVDFDGSDKTMTGNWHNVEMAQQAKRMGLQSWEQVAHTLEGFLFCDDVGHGAEEWFHWFMSVEETAST